MHISINIGNVSPSEFLFNSLLRYNLYDNLSFHPSVYLSWYIFRCCSTAFLFSSVYLSFLYVCPSVSFVHLFIYVWPFSYLSVCLSNLPSSMTLNDLGCPTLQPEQQTKHKKTFLYKSGFFLRLQIYRLQNLYLLNHPLFYGVDEKNWMYSNRNILFRLLCILTVHSFCCNLRTKYLLCIFMCRLLCLNCFRTKAVRFECTKSWNRIQTKSSDVGVHSSSFIEIKMQKMFPH